jgi:hypothetical protein
MRGEVVIQEVAPGVISIKLKGHLEVALAGQIMTTIDPILARGLRPHLFFDAEHATGLDTKFRTELTPWHKAIKPLVSGQNVLVRSKILQMAITVANMAMGDLLTAYNKRDEFEAAMAAARPPV